MPQPPALAKFQQKQAISPELDWSDYVELLPIKDDKARQRLEARIINEDLNS